MENYKIGIKLADGSFYPILEEGKPQSQKIELTTVRDDQTTVQLDLYRSSSDNMEDAEYVDTLLVENLLPRPKETPTLNLKIEIDAENVLSASIEDCESGESSETKVSLVTLDSSERTIVPDFSMIDAESADNEEEDSLLDESANNIVDEQEEVMASELSETDDLNLDDFGDVDELLSEDSELSQEIASSEENIDFEESELPMDDLVQDEPPVEVVSDDIIEENTEDNLDFENSFVAEDPTIAPVDDIPSMDDMPSFEEDTAVETSDELDDIPSMDEMPSFEEDTAVETPDELDDIPSMDEMPSFEDDTAVETSGELDDIPSMDEMPSFEEDTAVETSDELDDIPSMDEMPSFEEDTAVETSDELDDIPSMDDMPSFEEDTAVETSDELEDMPDIDIPVENDFASQETELSEEAFPDFSDIPTAQADKDESDLEDDDGFFGIGNDYGDLGDDMDIDDDMLETDAFASNVDTSGDLDDSIPSPDLSFSDLYVDPVEEESSEKKRCKIPVLICSLCAVICVIALLLILFLTPSKLKGKDENSENSIWQEETVVEEVATVPVPTEPVVEDAELDVLVEEEAKEDEIVIVEAPVVTPKEPEVIPEKLKGVEYKIKWGDTLWDIAGTYYKNPWLYKFIADYNNLENPDYIVSGTIITIPPR